MRGVSRLLFERLDHDRLDAIISNLARRAAARLVRQTVEPILGEARPPCANRLTRHAKRGRNLTIVRPVSCSQNNLSALRLCSGDLASTRSTFERLSLYVA